MSRRSERFLSYFDILEIVFGCAVVASLDKKIERMGNFHYILFMLLHDSFSE